MRRAPEILLTDDELGTLEPFAEAGFIVSAAVCEGNGHG